MVVEKWASVAALKAHSAARISRCTRAKTKDLIANWVIHVLAPA